ncbi:MAG: hypothetical protein EOL88_02540 [Bacteroidia bacterium]|nr:hypothetical protein [Bacteroidia bacterium]
MEITKELISSILNEAFEMLDEADTPEKQYEAINRLCQALSVMEPTLQELTIDQVKTKYKIPKSVIKQTLKSFGNGHVNDLEFVRETARDEIQEFGFYEENNKYIFLTKDGTVEGSNFIIIPLFHIYSKSDNKRLIKIVNEYGYERIVDIPSAKFTSFEQFQQLVYAEGNYLFFGNRHQFLKILSKISDRYPVCNELKTMGWQREGFFAFANGIFSHNTWNPVDEYGITEHNEKKYFSPAFSTVYSDVREDDDEYENDRFFVHVAPEINFNQWAKIFNTVYDDKAPWAISYLLASLFRDIIYDKFKFFPHLFLFGQPQSGKSALAWSLSNVFFQNLPAFNLNSGTNVGFFRRLARFRNTIAWFDEYTNEIDLKRFQALKAAYDGIGHEKGKTTKDNRTEVTKVNAACIISGQYLPTIDDNALFTRSILLSFPKRDANNPFTDAETKNLNRIREIEKNGLSGILTEILRYREKVERDYPMTYTEVYNTVKEYFVSNQKQYTERIILNFVSILTMVRIFDNISEIKLGFTYNELLLEALRMIEKQSSQISESDALSNLWSSIQFLFETQQINEDVDFKFKTVSSVKLVNATKTFGKPRELLYLRFTKIHPLYLEAHRKQHGTTGVDITSLRHYISNHLSYLGNVSSEEFNNTITSAYVFDYQQLVSNLENIGFNLKKTIFIQDTNPTKLKSNEESKNYFPF